VACSDTAVESEDDEVDGDFLLAEIVGGVEYPGGEGCRGR